MFITKSNSVNIKHCSGNDRSAPHLLFLCICKCTWNAVKCEQFCSIYFIVCFTVNSCFCMIIYNIANPVWLCAFCDYTVISCFSIVEYILINIIIILIKLARSLVWVRGQSRNPVKRHSSIGKAILHTP